LSRRADHRPCVISDWGDSGRSRSPERRTNAKEDTDWPEPTQEGLDALRGYLDRLLFRPQRRYNASKLLLNPQRVLFQVPLPAPRSPRARRRASGALYRRHHPRRNAGTGQQAEREHADADGCADRPDGQQFGPPQASKTGSLCTEATIAAPMPTASASNTTISAVIFTIPP
jgi:hypothetical protein